MIAEELARLRVLKSVLANCFIKRSLNIAEELARARVLKSPELYALAQSGNMIAEELARARVLKYLFMAYYADGHFQLQRNWPVRGY